MADRSAVIDGHPTPLVERVRQALAQAEADGDQPPGRVTLARQLGAKPHDVRRVLDIIRAETAPEPAGHQLAPRGGTFVAWTGFAFGSLVSIAANVLASWLPPAHAPKGWHPSISAEIGAAVFPVALLLSVELLARIRWSNGYMWQLARFGGAGTVALGSAVISYTHITEVLTSWGYSPLGAHVGPLVIDGLMTISGFALLATANHTAPAGATQATSDTSAA